MSKCKSKLGQSLSKHVNQHVTLRTKTGDVIEGELRRVTSDCLVRIRELEMVSPGTGRTLTVIHSRDIESFSVTRP
jgi:hypothetical protein